jgi:hypothetical protein
MDAHAPSNSNIRASIVTLIMFGFKIVRIGRFQDVGL